jgi:ferric enterobactin receptor
MSLRRSLALCLSLLVSASTLSAQAAPAGPPSLANRPPALSAANVTPPGVIRGKMVDSASQRPVTTGSITVRRQRDSVFATGALPGPDGGFAAQGLVPGAYVVRLRAIGFGQVSRNVTITPDKPLVDLGTILLSAVVVKLDEQKVTAAADEVVVQPDRTVYSAKNMPAATGGTALDVLRNIPQVEVGSTNNVSLRGNGNVVIQINGRPTPVKGDQLGAMLAQLPAHSLKSVEVAANPSAKDDPEGTAGIINLVLNQEAELGLSGGFNLSSGSTGQVGFGGNVGKQQGKFTTFLSLNGMMDRRLTNGTIARENVVASSPKYVDTDMDGRGRMRNGGGNLRTEYRFSPKNTLTLDSYTFAGHFNLDNTNVYSNLDGSRTPMGSFNQLNEQNNHNLAMDFDLAFRRIGKPLEPQLTLEVEHSYNRQKVQFDLSGAVTAPDATTPSSIRTSQDHLEASIPFYMGKFDYVKPFNPKTKLEFGAKFMDRGTNTIQDATTMDSTGAYARDTLRSNDFRYRELISSGYLLISRSFKGKIQSQVGLRLEDAQTQFDLPLTTLPTIEKRYQSAYPSAVVSYAFKPTRTVRATYSRRVARPNPFQMSPVELRQDARNVQRGNPNLGAEYTDAVDFTVQEARKWGAITLAPFMRRSNNAMRGILFVDTNGVAVRTFANLAHNSTIGTDLNVNIRKGKFVGAVGAGASQYESDASNVTLTTTSLSTKAFSWNARANGTWTFSKKFDSQIFTNYRAPTKTEGGSSLANVNLGFSLRYKRWGDQGSISLRLADPFKMTRFGYRTANGQIVELQRNSFNSRAVFLGLTRNFGQAIRLKAKTESEGDAQTVTPP